MDYFLANISGKVTTSYSNLQQLLSDELKNQEIIQKQQLEDKEEAKQFTKETFQELQDKINELEKNNSELHIMTQKLQQDNQELRENPLHKQHKHKRTAEIHQLDFTEIYNEEKLKNTHQEQKLRKEVDSLRELLHSKDQEIAKREKELVELRSQLQRHQFTQYFLPSRCSSPSNVTSTTEGLGSSWTRDCDSDNGSMDSEEDFQYKPRLIKQFPLNKRASLPAPLMPLSSNLFLEDVPPSPVFELRSTNNLFPFSSPTNPRKIPTPPVSSPPLAKKSSSSPLCSTPSPPSYKKPPSPLASSSSSSIISPQPISPLSFSSSSNICRSDLPPITTRNRSPSAPPTMESQIPTQKDVPNTPVHIRKNRNKGSFMKPTRSSNQRTK